MDEEEKTAEEYVIDIQKACASLGWVIAMNGHKDGVKGLVIGRADYINEIVDQLENHEEYEIWAQPEMH